MAQAESRVSEDRILRCERCWSIDDVELFRFMATGLPSRNDVETGIPLCHECRRKAPRDPLVFKEIFLRFGSPKELMSNYSVTSEREAIARLCQERNLDFENMMARISGSRQSSKVETQKSESRNSTLHLWGPFGYQYDDTGLVVMEAEAKVVLEIFKLYMEGLGIAKICRDLNKKGHRTRTGKAWAPQTIANILSNPIYCGYKKMEDDIKPMSHKSLVTVETFNNVQEEMQRRIRRPDQKSEICLILPLKDAKVGDS